MFNLLNKQLQRNLHFANVKTKLRPRVMLLKSNLIHYNKKGMLGFLVVVQIGDDINNDIKNIKSILYFKFI